MLQFAKLISRFAKEIGDTPLPEYPRPQLVRDSYINLNGWWDYAINKNGEELTKYQGKILVPFSPESILSGVERILLPDEVLYYRRTFTLPSGFKKDRVILHFGAVDYLADVYVNNILVVQNKGGYFPFEADITNALIDGENILSVVVVDPSDTGIQSKGKQKIKRGGIFYTPQSGIWQTVWIESVAKDYIKSLSITPNIDNNSVHIKVHGAANGEIEILDGDLSLLTTTFSDGEIRIPFANYTLWTPEQPKLYDIRITAGLDTVSSYFGMRKFGLIEDSDGYMRLGLNNKPYFHNGLLDQGYFSDGLYTPPSDAAMIYDIQTTKDMGFNMLRKHIKIEPLRWYYHCDRLGVLVWQDMINGGKGANNILLGVAAFTGIKIKDRRYSLFGRSDAAGRKEYYTDTKRTIELLYNTVSLALWVPFNESWGQFDALEAYNFVKMLDSTRPIDHASGWFDQGGGDFKSLHIYFRPITIGKDKRAIILSEFGGFSVKVDGHIYNLKRSFGYKKFKTLEDFENAYHKLYKQSVIPKIKQGLAATVYTQITDVEDEINGLITYDRAVIKVDLDRIRELNKKLKL